MGTPLRWPTKKEEREKYAAGECPACEGNMVQTIRDDKWIDVCRSCEKMEHKVVVHANSNRSDHLFRGIIVAYVYTIAGKYVVEFEASQDVKVYKNLAWAYRAIKKVAEQTFAEMGQAND